MSDKLVHFIRDYFSSNAPIPLHAPTFNGHEKKLMNDVIESTFVSSVGQYVERFENDIMSYTSAPMAIATMNGTAALHVALKIAGVSPNDLVITQPLTFVATCNAISYLGAEPIFVDVDLETLGLSAKSMENWLIENAEIDDQGVCKTKIDQKVIRACVPMHTFGHPADLQGLMRVAHDWKLSLIEDAAESLGSFYKGKHTGTFGDSGALSFNGNKIITTGGGGMILTSKDLGRHAKHITTTSKIPHTYEYIHDDIGYNYRLPNLNAALGCAQMEQLNSFIKAKRALAYAYDKALAGSNFVFVKEPSDCRSNYWLNAVICEDRKHRDHLLEFTNKQYVTTRPIWKLMTQLKMYKHCRHDNLNNAKWLAERVVNLPSSAMIF